MNLNAFAAEVAGQTIPGLTVPGLPRVGGVAGFGIGLPPLVATSSQLPFNQAPNIAAVTGAPSMRIVKGTDGSVTTVIERVSAYTELIPDSGIAMLTPIANKMLADAIALSQGGLTTKLLRRMGHPYGRGLTPAGKRRRGLGRLQGSRAGISNLAVVNRQSGEFAGAWRVILERFKNGIRIRLENTASVAAYLAFGTTRMRAHGPFTTAVARHLAELNEAWRRLAYAAWRRTAASSQVGVTATSNLAAALAQVGAVA